MPRYLITLSDQSARRLEQWLGGSLVIGPVGCTTGVPVAGLDAVTDDEVTAIRGRLTNGGPIYHQGGPGRIAIPEGFEYVAEPDPAWRLVEGKRCRYGASRGVKACGAPAVAELNRGGQMRAQRRGATRDSWWAYCGQHLYGRWIENGQVMRRVLRTKESTHS